MKKFCVTIIALSFATQSLANNTNHSDSSKKLSTISKQIAAAQKNLKQTLAQQNILQAQLQQSEQSIGSLSTNIHRLNQNIDKNTTQLAALTAKQQQYELLLTKQRVELAQQMRIAYQTSRENYLKILLDQEDPYELSRIMTYYQYFSRAHVNAIHLLLQTLTDINQTQSEIKKSTKKLQQLLNDRLQQQTNLKQSRQQRQKILTQLHSKVETQNQRLKTLQANKRELEKVLSTLREQQAQTPYIGGSFANMKGHLMWPTRGPITHRFGSQMTQDLRYSGVFIKAPEGQGIHAIAPGKIVFSNWLKGFGLLLIIDHGNGYMSLYAQCNALYKSVGDTVTTDEPIASVGNSGGAEEMGLMFQIRQNGTPVDPSIWCK